MLAVLMIALSGAAVFMLIGEKGEVPPPPPSRRILQALGSNPNDPAWTIDVIGDENFRILSDSTVRMLIDSNGNVGIGTTVPSSLLSVGSTSQFQVNSSGAIAAATGITSSGTINFSGLTASKVVFTDVSKNLSSTGTVGVDQGGTGLTALGTANQLLGVNSGATANEYKNIASLLTNGTNISISGTTNATIATVDNPTFSTSVTSPIYTASGALDVKPGSDSTTAIQLQTSGGTSVLNVDTTNQRVGIGVTGPTALLDLAGSSTSMASLRIEPGTAPTTPNEGDIWYDSTQKALVENVDNIKQALVGTIFSQYAAVIVANTTTETTLTSATAVGTRTLPAGFFVPGKTLRVTAWGVLSDASTAPTLRIKVKLGSTIILDTAATSLTTTSMSNRGWEVSGVITCYSTGASGTVRGQGSFIHVAAATGTIAYWEDMETTAAVTVDTTASQTVDVTAQWGTASSSNTITCTNLLIEVLE